jgi:DNA mismatch repair protein MutL
MTDIIKLLPDFVANQIAAGEVIQRPASVIKELLENAIDSGATKIQLMVKDAGRTLIQVIDNGCGMSETDARMSFERHATSKITDAAQLFTLRTKGFRGEALASIAAIAHVELKTRQNDQEIGSILLIEGSEVKSQKPGACSVGTSMAVRNLFFNVPARRNFLKTDPVELRHMIDEFERVVLAHPEIAFTFHHNDTCLFEMPASNLRQRIVAVFGSKFNERLVPVDETTPVVKVEGFIGKPEFSRKMRGEQFFFVNKRFIKSSYLNHAVSSAYQELISQGVFPAYFIFLEIDPSEIDINIHPTKTEIKFKDEKLVYAMLNSAVKRGLGRFNLTPSLDFERETVFDFPDAPRNREITAPVIQVNPSYNPFVSTAPMRHTGTGHTAALDKMRGMYEQTSAAADLLTPDQNPGRAEMGEKPSENQGCFQLHNKYILTTFRTGAVLIHQQRAHERVLYEQFVQSMAMNSSLSQQELFPETLRFSTGDAALLKTILPEVRQLGFDIEELGQQGFAINGIPADSGEVSPRELLESFIEQYRMHDDQKNIKKGDKVARSLAATLAIKSGKKLQTPEMQNLIDSLFGCEVPGLSPSGKTVIVSFTNDEIDSKFEK